MPCRTFDKLNIRDCRMLHQDLHRMLLLLEPSCITKQHISQCRITDEEMNFTIYSRTVYDEFWKSSHRSYMAGTANVVPLLWQVWPTMHSTVPVPPWQTFLHFWQWREHITTCLFHYYLQYNTHRSFQNTG